MRLTAACVAGLALRAAIVGSVEYNNDAGDAVGYLAIANNLATHGVFAVELGDVPEPSMVRPPLYPFFLAAKTAVFGRAPLVTQVLQILLSMVSPLVLFAVARKHWPAQATAVLWVAMLCPSDGFYAGAHLSETLCTTLLTVAVCVPALRPNDVRSWCIGGVFAGLCILTRDVYIPVMLALGALGLGSESGRFHAKRTFPLLFMAFALLTVVPWTARNVVVMHRAVPVSHGLLGMNLWFGTWERDGEWVSERGPELRHYPAEAYRHDRDRARVAALIDLPSDAQDRGFMALAIERIRESPGRTLITYASRAPSMWLGTRAELFEFRASALARGQPAWYLVKASLYALNLAAILGAFVCIVLGARRDGRILWFSTPVVLTACIYLPMHNTETRYTQPVYPLVLLLAVLGALELAQAARARWQPRQGT